MELKPLADRVIVKRIAEEDKTPGGIFIPDHAKEKPCRGVVIAAGPGVALEDGLLRRLSVKPGDHVLFAKFAGTEVKVDGEEHLIMREEDILCAVVE